MEPAERVERVAELEAENALQRELIARPEARIVELERLLGKPPATPHEDVTIVVEVR